MGKKLVKFCLCIFVATLIVAGTYGTLSGGGLQDPPVISVGSSVVDKA
jgi:hypothetical protein